MAFFTPQIVLDNKHKNLDSLLVDPCGLSLQPSSNDCCEDRRSQKLTILLGNVWWHGTTFSTIPTKTSPTLPNLRKFHVDIHVGTSRAHGETEKQSPVPWKGTAGVYSRSWCSRYSVYRKGNHATYCISSWSSIWMFRSGNLHIVSYRKLLDTKSHVNEICQNITKNCFPYMLFMYLNLCSNEVHIESIYVFTLI